jgi:pentatricopeptide repeat protein
MEAEGNAPTVLTYNPLLDGLVANRMLHDAMGVLQQARSAALLCPLPIVVSCSPWLPVYELASLLNILSLNMY